MKKLKVYEVSTMNESIRHIIRIATDYKSDVDEIKFIDFKSVYDYCQSKYKKEVGEIFRRPKFFVKDGGDCDCQAIFVIAIMLKYNVPKHNINLKVCGNFKYGHIFPIITVGKLDLYFDMLPGRKFNEKHNYKLNVIFNYFT
jgi:hypothetical protein